MHTMYASFCDSLLVIIYNQESKMKNFEERLKKLEEIVEKIKNNDVPIENAISMFEEGMKISKTLEKDIEKMEGKVSILMNQPLEPDEKPELELFS